MSEDNVSYSYKEACYLVPDDDWDKIQDRLKRADELEAENKKLRFHIKESARIRSGEE